MSRGPGKRNTVAYAELQAVRSCRKRLRVVGEKTPESEGIVTL